MTALAGKHELEKAEQLLKPTSALKESISENVLDVEN